MYLYEIFTSKDRSICTLAFAISFAHYWWSLKNFVSVSSFFLYTLNQADTGNNMEKGGGNNISERLLGVIARSRFNLINALLSSDSHPSMPRQYLWLLVVFLLPSYFFIRNVSALPNWGRHWRRSAPATTSLSLISSIGGWLFEWLVSKSPVTAKPSICWIEWMILGLDDDDDFISSELLC